jgi:hypothetical protein
LVKSIRLSDEVAARNLLAAAEAVGDPEGSFTPTSLLAAKPGLADEDGDGWEGQDKASAMRLAVPEMCLISLVN